MAAEPREQSYAAGGDRFGGSPASEPREGVPTGERAGGSRSNEREPWGREEAIAQIEAGVAALSREPLSGAVDEAVLLSSVIDIVRLERKLAAERLRRVAEADASGAYQVAGVGSTTRWLVETLHRTYPEALAEVRTAVALGELPSVRARLAAGECSEGHAQVTAQAWRELRRNPPPVPERETGRPGAGGSTGAEGARDGAGDGAGDGGEDGAGGPGSGGTGPVDGGGGVGAAGGMSER